MNDMADSGLRILAVYERKTPRCTEDSEGVVIHADSLRVDGKGIIPRAGPDHRVQINLEGDPANYRFPVPVEFNRQGFFIVKSEDLPVMIPYGKTATISILGKRRTETILAKTPLRYQTRP
jgi:hypothetical protein